jgi:hypothetical protein
MPGRLALLPIRDSDPVSNPTSFHHGEVIVNDDTGEVFYRKLSGDVVSSLNIDSLLGVIALWESSDWGSMANFVSRVNTIITAHVFSGETTFNAGILAYLNARTAANWRAFTNFNGALEAYMNAMAASGTGVANVHSWRNKTNFDAALTSYLNALTSTGGSGILGWRNRTNFDAALTSFLNSRVAADWNGYAEFNEAVSAALEAEDNILNYLNGLTSADAAGGWRGLTNFKAALSAYLTTATTGFIYANSAFNTRINDLAVTAIQAGNDAEFGAVQVNDDLDVTGTVTAAVVNTTSKRDLKTEIIDLPISATDLINGIKVVQFRFKDGNGGLRIGFIADDTDPLLSGENQDKFDINNVVGTLLAAFQEQSKELAALRNRVECL